jgi:hypothetical protein
LASQTSFFSDDLDVEVLDQAVVVVNVTTICHQFVIVAVFQVEVVDSVTVDLDANRHAGAAQDPVIVTAVAVDAEADRVQRAVNVRDVTEAGKGTSNDVEAEAVHPLDQANHPGKFTFTSFTFIPSTCHFLTLYW